MSKRHIWLPILALAFGGCSAPPAVSPGTSVQPTSSPSAPAPAVSAAPTAPASVSLNGKVVNDDLDPVVATITAKAEGGSPVSVTSEADGTYSLVLPVGTYTVVATKAGWTTREQSIALTADSTLNFGGVTPGGSDPYYLSNTPEIVKVEVSEQATGGPLSVTLRLSEPIAKAAQDNFTNRLEIASNFTTEFILAGGAPDELLKSSVKWDEAGQSVTLAYPGPYLASGPAPAVYTVRLRQGALDKTDPVTLEKIWDDMGIVDGEGNALGYNRAEFAFKKDQLFPITYEQLANKALGYTPAKRRWTLTHQSGHTFSAAKDDKGPGLVSARVTTDTRIGDSVKDVLELHFNEPMWVVKSREFLQYNQLDRIKELVLLSVSDSADGSSPQPFGTNYKIESIRFSRLDPTVVYLQYAPGAFKNKKWVEVTLGADMLDPAGNRPDPAKSKVVGLAG